MQPATSSERDAAMMTDLGVPDFGGIAGGAMVDSDPVSFLRSLAAAAAALAKNPVGALAANVRLSIGLAAALRAASVRALGGEMAGPVSATGDKRFADPAYTDNPLYFLLAQQYLLSSELVGELL